MSTRWSPHRTELLVLGALLLSPACDADDAAPPGVTSDPSIGEDASGDEDAGAGVEEEEVDASERADSGARDAGRDGGTGPDADDPEPDAATGDAGGSEDAGRADAGSPISRGELWSVERLLVADAKQPSFYVVDGAGGQLLERFDLAGTGSVHAGPGGRFGYVLQPEKDLVHVIDMGLVAGLDPMSRELVRPAKVLLPAVAGARPRSFSVQGKDLVNIFFEGGAELISLRDGALAVEGPSARFAAGQPHAGFVLGLGSEVLATSRAGDETVLARLDDQLRPTTDPGFACSAPSAGAASGKVAGVSCLEGVLRYTAGGSSAALVPYPALSQPEGTVAERLLAHSGQAIFLSVFDGRACVVRDAFQCTAPLAAGVADYSFDHDAGRVLVLTLDGVLHVLDSETLEAYTQVNLLSPAGDAERPSLALGRTYLYVSDPHGARVLRVSPNNGSLVDSIPIAGASPGKLAVFRYPD